MKKSSIFTSIATALTLSAGVALAKGDTEKCAVVNKEPTLSTPLEKINN